MHESVIGVSLVLSFAGLLLCVNNMTNKWWARLVPAAAVTPAPQVATTIIGSKASVADLAVSCEIV